jgi:hypothetical protein
MRHVILLLALAGCPKPSEPQAPIAPPPPPADAGRSSDPGPMQTPQASTAIRASSYPQSCTRDGECVGVFEGDACNPCRCAFNAIRADALTKYKADLNSFWSCHKPEDCKTECHQVTGDAAKCAAGACILPP